MELDNEGNPQRGQARSKTPVAEGKFIHKPSVKEDIEAIIPMTDGYKTRTNEEVSALDNDE